MDFTAPTPKQFSPVTAAQYRARAALAASSSQYPAAALLGMLDALWRGQGVKVAAEKLRGTKRDVAAEFDRIRPILTSREYIPQIAQVAMLAELRDRVSGP